MELVRGLHNLKPCHKGCILAIGNFDGFHLGHKFLIEKLYKKKINYKLPVMVMIFEPHPKEYFYNLITIRLTRLRDKIHYLFDAGVDVVLCIAFNRKFASIGAYSFIKNILIYKLKVQFVCVGNDFRFGAFRRGDLQFLKKIGKHEGFRVIESDTYYDSYGYKISSTTVRTALIENRIIDAELLMGHSYCISGKVVHGDRLGRKIGFPTANIFLQGKQLPVSGVYAVEVHGVLDLPIPGVANIGIRPTIYSTTKQQRLEVHLLNISINLYSYYVKVVFLAKIRDEQYFDSINRLQNQIYNDVMEVRNYFKKKWFNNIAENNLL